MCVCVGMWISSETTTRSGSDHYIHTPCQLYLRSHSPFGCTSPWVFCRSAIHYITLDMGQLKKKVTPLAALSSTSCFSVKFNQSNKQNTVFSWLMSKQMILLHHGRAIYILWDGRNPVGRTDGRGWFFLSVFMEMRSMMKVWHRSTALAQICESSA